MSKEYYTNLEDKFRKLYYSHKHDEAKALYEENVEKGFLPRLLYNKEVLALGNHPEYMCVDWDREEYSDSDKSDCIYVIAMFFPELIQI